MCTPSPSSWQWRALSLASSIGRQPQVGSANFWTTWGGLAHCIRTGEAAFSHLFGVHGTFEWLAAHPEDAALFNAGMADVAVTIAKAIIASYDFSSARVVV